MAAIIEEVWAVVKATEVMGVEPMAGTILVVAAVSVEQVELLEEEAADTTSARIVVVVTEEVEAPEVINTELVKMALVV